MRRAPGRGSRNGTLRRCTRMSVIKAFERAILARLSPAGPRARLLILTYHRVLARPDPLLKDEPDAKTFAAQMDVLSSYCNVLPLPEAVARLKSGSLPSRAACITFDDGYANNLEVRNAHSGAAGHDSDGVHRGRSDSLRDHVERPRDRGRARRARHAQAVGRWMLPTANSTIRPTAVRASASYSIS